MASPRRVLADLKVFIRGYTRSKIGLFFSLIFPIILILLFGAIFSGGNSGPISVFVQNRDSGPVGGYFISALNSTNTIRPNLVENSVDFKQYLLSHSSSTGISIPVNFNLDYKLKRPVNVTLYSNPADTSSIAVLAVVNGVINGFNLRAQCQSSCSPVVGLEQSPITSESAKYIDFLVPGLIGFSVLTSPMFTIENIGLVRTL